MGNYSVPESIRKYKPKGTMVKAISGHYYVYEYTMVKGPLNHQGRNRFYSEQQSCQ